MKIYRLIATGVAMLFAAPALADMTPAEQQETLAAHNNERANYPGVNPLQWSPELAGFAQEWANQRATSGRGDHRPDTTINLFKPGEYLGENISWRSPSNPGPQAVQGWIYEKTFYHRDLDDGFGASQNRPPGCTPPAESPYCGHFTQVVWSATQFVGCGKAQSTLPPWQYEYVVCNYYPGGNIRGQFPFAAAPTPPTPQYQVRSGEFGRCLDADSATIGQNGTIVQLWDCNGGPNQQWGIRPDGRIVNGQSGRCLDADWGPPPRTNYRGGINGTKVQLWDCSGQPQQYWLGTSQTELRNGQSWLSTDQSGRCLDADSATNGQNGTKVQLWDCHGLSEGKNQSWWRYAN